MPKKSKSASKPTDPLSRVRGAIGDRKSWTPIHSALDAVKNDAHPADFDRLLSLARISPMATVALPAVGVGRRVSGLQAIAPLDTATIYREIVWSATVIAANSNLIVSYLPLRSDFERCFLLGRYGEAILVLNKIEKACGLSLWSIENRIALLMRQGGFENLRDYVSFITTTYKRSFLAFFAANIRERNESRVSAKGYERRLRDRAKTWNIGADQKEYIFFRLLTQMPSSLDGAASILSFEAASSSIDLYETFITLLVHLSQFSGLKNELILKALEQIIHIPDHCLTNLLYVFNTSTIAPIQDPSYLQHLLSGKYSASAEELSRYLPENPSDALAIVTCCLLGLISKTQVSKFGDTIPELRRLFCELKGQPGNGPDPSDELEKLSRNLRHLSIARTIALLGSSHENLSILRIHRETAVRSPILSVHSLSAMSLKSLISISEAGDSIESSSSYRFHLIATKGEDGLPSISHEAKRLAFAAYFSKNHKYEKALSSLTTLKESNEQFFREEAAIQEAWLLFRNGQILEALERSIRIAIARPTQDRALPIGEIIRPRGFRELKQAQDQLLLAIAFFQFGLLMDDGTKDVALKVAWKQLLKSHNVTRPSELSNHSHLFDEGEFIYFLRYVCVQEVMELGNAFNSPADLDAERLQICLLLRELDQANIHEYDAEVLELTRRSSIEEGVRHVDSSRVYVDVVGIERWCQANLGESFLRYLDYAGAGLQASVGDLERRLVEIIKSGGKINEIETFLDSYDISADSILQDVLEAIATAFMTLPRYGLDAFLGSRVRHGSLEGIFRSPLERLKLITKIDSRTNEYEDNEYWLASLQLQDDAKRKAISRTLKLLSKNIDALIDSAVSRYVHVRSESHREGLISLWKSEDIRRQYLLRWVIQAKLGLNPQSTLSQFVNYCCYSLFWPSLGASLELVQRFCQDELSAAIVRCLEAAEKDIASILPAERVTGLAARIRSAKQEVVTSANKSASWFRVPKEPSADSSYSLKTAIEIGMQSTRMIWRNFEVDVEWRVEESANVQLITGAFEIINDAAFLIFGNIAKHSGFFISPDSPSYVPRVTIDIHTGLGASIEVCVKSEIADGVNMSSIEESVADAKATIASRKYEEVVSRKRGTGLVRLASTLNHENNADKTLDFGIDDAKRFFVVFSLPMYVLTGPTEAAQ